MTQRINLADPDFEPSDEQLMELSKRAFAGIAEANAARVRALHEEIIEARKVLLQQLKAQAR